MLHNFLALDHPRAARVILIVQVGGAVQQGQAGGRPVPTGQMPKVPNDKPGSLLCNATP